MADVEQPNDGALAVLSSWIKAEIKVVVADPKAWIRSQCFSIGGYIKRQWSFFLSPRGLKMLAKTATRKILETVALLLLVYAAVHLHFLGRIGDAILSFSSASQKDIKDLTDLMASYQDYLNQRNVQANRALAREHELFSDVVSRVFPLKWDSDLVSLSQNQLDALNNGATVNVQAHFRSFKGIPYFYAILKNLSFNIQPDRTTGVTLQCACATSHCKVLLKLNQAPRAGQRVLLITRPQVHWIASGEFPSDDDAQDNLPEKEVACSR
ncbi:hypothetical protein [Bradyrhizobium sp. CCBAU 65884]|uniref:hypothetical protein n=1 Tax=Bradyrhizobium sp. CCBAU 65884 TaxID=722477 RepID=UPI002304E82F|nr:hypothetical protein [Bradyrhizobium sp. CCBAU 65884]